MYSRDAQDKFVELRAQGWTLPHIATELHVSKRTLVDWNREFAADVKSMRALELELLKEKFLASREEDLNRLARLKKDVDDELSGRTLKFLSIEKLFRLSLDLGQQIQDAQQNTEEEPSPTTGVASANGQAANGPKSNH